MKTKFFIPFLLLISSILLSQTSNINQENGVANYGYDVVSYFSGKPQHGSAKNAVKYQGTDYYFVNAENKAKFQKEPGKYLPQYGGYCAFAMGDYGKKVQVDPKTYKITDGKLYLFYNKLLTNTLTSWNKDEKNLVIKADKNWKKFTTK
ncbi:YHS domain-containing (seleno)protein [Chryseobacterium takakiae]|uniref:YHS domain-containing protein n=1 Tax=Chryseobacterium takakiae TaxID=1302685 RepID=A0A1M4Y3M6_9FLAO|nr:YHS domain-containing (seleno)protein [Chryseobacterium takakiae]SHF00351.1 YHS domain-containing protein [Chryseobacterium takakiae]